MCGGDAGAGAAAVGDGCGLGFCASSGPCVLGVLVGWSIALEQNAEIQSAALARGDDVTYLEFEEEAPGSDFLRAWDLWKRQLGMQ